MMKNKLNSQAGEFALQQGIAAARAGYKSLASVQLERAAELLPDNAEVWLWLAWLANSPDNTRQCLQQVLELSPGHPAATAGMIWVNSLTANEVMPVVTTGVLSVAHREIKVVEAVAAPSADRHSMQMVEKAGEKIAEPATEQLPRSLLSIVDPRDGFTTTIAASQSTATPQPATSEPVKAFDRDGWEISQPSEPVVAKTDLAQAEVATPSATITAAALTAIKDQQILDDQQEESSDSEASRRRRWTDLVSRAAEMPLSPRSKSPGVVEEKKPVIEVTVPSPEVTAAAAVVTDAATEISVPAATSATAAAPEAVVQSRFTEVPAAAPRSEASATTINDSVIRMRQPSPARVKEPELETSADIEKLAQSFNPLTDAVAVDGRPLVMVVDDSPTVRKLVSLTLERRGYRVISAFDGVAAIKELGSNRPDLILLDINMPRLDGYRLCKLIKKHEATQNIPVVMLSGKDGMFDKLRGRLVGCSDYITKPFEADALTVKVAKYLTPTVASSL